MDLPALRCFVAVAEELHFGKAAVRLHLTPSPVSRMVRALEREFGGPLFVRSHHDVRLTPLGEALVQPARRVVQDADRLSGIAEGVLARNRILRVGASYLISPGLTDRFVEAVEEAAAPGRVDVASAMSSVLIPDVVAGALDLAMVHLPVADPAVDSLGVTSYRFHVAMRSDDELAARADLTLRDLAERTLIMHPVTTQPLAVGGLHQRLAEAGISRIYQMPSPDVMLLAAHIRRHRGITLTTDPADGGGAGVFLHPSFAVVPLVDDAPTIEVGVVWNRARYDGDGVVRAAVERLREHREDIAGSSAPNRIPMPGDGR